MPTPLRIVYMGSPDFAVPSLEALHRSKHTIVSVISGEDKRRGRGSETSPTPVKKRALELSLPVFEADSMKSEALFQHLVDCKPDLIVVVAFKILPESLLRIPKIGAVNLHASLLPKYRGAAPIHHAVMNGETETGNSIFFLDAKMDTGQILFQRKIPIGNNETTGDVYQKLMTLGAEMMPEAMDMISSGTYTLHTQDDTLASKAPKIFPDDARIDCTASADRVHNLIRGMSPHPGAWLLLDGQKLKVYRSKIATGVSIGTPGTLSLHENQATLFVKDGAVWLEQVQLQGRKQLDGRDFLLGYPGDGIISVD